MPNQSAALDRYYHEIQDVILSRQNPITGLVEKFKYTQSPLDALHAKYSTTTGNTAPPPGMPWWVSANGMVR
jgi:hypothetical protein